MVNFLKLQVEAEQLEQGVAASGTGRLISLSGVPRRSPRTPGRMKKGSSDSEERKLGAEVELELKVDAERREENQR